MKKGFGLVGILIVIGIIVLGGGGYYYLSNENNKTIDDIPEEHILDGNGNVTEEEPHRITQDETVDWKTYTNEKYGYKLKYPSNWVEDCPRMFYRGDEISEPCSYITYNVFFHPAEFTFGDPNTTQPYFSVLKGTYSLAEIEAPTNILKPLYFDAVQNYAGFNKIQTFELPSGEKGYLIEIKYLGRNGEYSSLSRYIACFDYPYSDKVEKLIDKYSLMSSGAIPKSFRIDFGFKFDKTLIDQVLSSFEFIGIK
jgi:hypothetical protein